MSSYLGFTESGNMLPLRTAVLAAIGSPSVTDFYDAWRNYQREAESRIESLPDDSQAHAAAQVGLILCKALIWYEAGDLVRYYEEYLSAMEYAGYVSLVVPTAIMSEFQETTSLTTMAESLQAHGQYDDALDLYIAAEVNDLSDPERGNLNFRMAECYWRLIREGGNREELESLLLVSLETALEDLKGTPTWAWAHRLLEESELDL